MKTKRYATATVKALDETDDAFPGSFEVVLSAPTLDRDGEIVDVDKKCFGPVLPEHITFDVDHGLSVESTIGSGSPRYEKGFLKVSGTYCEDPFSQMVRGKVKGGHIRTCSVAYIETKRVVKDGKPHITEAELLNGSFVSVPSNREAIVLGAKGSKDAPARLKSIVGSVEALRDRVADALDDAYSPDWGTYWGYLRGVIPDAAGGGKVVFDTSRLGDGYEYSTYEQAYTDDGAVVTLVGEAAEVDIHEIVVPDADANRDGTASAPPAGKTVTAPKGTKEADAQGAADQGLSDEDERQELVLRIRGIRALANSAT